MQEDEIRERLRDRILPRVADATGLNYDTVRRFARGEGPFRRSTIKTLERYVSQ